MYTIMEGVATQEARTKSLSHSMAQLMGLLTLADFIGLDASALTSCVYCSPALAIQNTGRVHCSSRWLTRGVWAASQDVGSYKY